ncbi:MAG: hypothetical protein KAQ98_13230 [Bacteriovoracaceae bacterium]|nr:hypothetical protein [Bacteriovoracaceae bacterium]
MKSTSLFKIFSILVIFICAFGYIDNWFMLSFFSITTIFISAYLSKRHAFKLCLEHNVKQIDIFIPLMAGVVSLIILVVLVLSGSLSAIVYGKLIAVFFIGLGILLIYGYGILKSLEMDFKNPPDDKIYIGHEVSSFFPSAVFIPEVVRSQHQIIFGTTGSGKTVSVLYPQIEHDIRTGKVVVILDPKGGVPRTLIQKEAVA